MNLAFRVDASAEIGLGHVMRCLALAGELLLSDNRSVFLCRQVPLAIRCLIVESGHELIELPASPPSNASNYASWLRTSQKTDARDVREALKAYAPIDWLICDHYGIDREWQCLLRTEVANIAVIDDLANRPHECDMIVDTNCYDDFERRYEGLVPSAAARLLGPQYAILRPEFRKLRKQFGVVRQDNRLLVSIGGADLPNYTLSVLNALDHLPAFAHVDVVIGAEHPDIAGIHARAVARGYKLHIQTSRLAELMLRATMGVGAGGTSTAERMCLGLPCLVLVVAENQRQLVDEAARRGDIYAPDIAPSDEVQVARGIDRLRRDWALMQRLAKRGQALVDGHGATRIVKALKACQKEDQT